MSDGTNVTGAATTAETGNNGIAATDAATLEEQTTEGLALDDFLDDKEEAQAQGVYYERFAMPTSKRDFFGADFSPRIEFEIVERNRENTEPEMFLVIKIGNGEYVKDAEAFQKAVAAHDTRGAYSGIDDAFTQRMGNKYWDRTQKNPRGGKPGQYVEIPNIDPTKGQSAYDYAVCGYSEIVQRGKKDKDLPHGPTQTITLPMDYLLQALREHRTVRVGRVMIQALNLVDNDQDMPAKRLIVSLDPLWNRVNGKAYPGNGVYRRGVMALLDDPRFSLLLKQAPRIMFRKSLSLRAMTDYPLYPGMSAADEAAALAQFRVKFWSMAKLFHKTGTPLAGMEVLLFMGAGPDMFTIEHMQEAFADCLGVLQDPTSTESAKQQARETWKNLDRICRVIKAFIEVKDGEAAKRLAAKEQRKQLEAPKRNGATTSAAEASTDAKSVEAATAETKPAADASPAKAPAASTDQGGSTAEA